MEIFGFKSFKKKTILEFSDREMTGIVGPNGCGKSNVVEALLWVMGESSPKNLRGESLSDIIFSGTKKEELENLVEVNLILGKGSFGFPLEYAKFSEVMITRRAYRDGKNEYFMNQQSCLLKEIREFFMNTGAGCRGFSVIEQESIEKLITAKPKERRFIIEEVAGITKFKSRKQESERKLLLVNQNLQRLEDILKIQESQLNKLISQAKQAKKYRDFKQELQTRQIQIEKRDKEETFQNYQLLKEEQNKLQGEKGIKEKDIQNLEANKEKVKADLDSIKKQTIEKSAQLEIVKSQEVEKRMGLQSLKVMESIKARKESLIESIKAKKSALKEKEKEIQKNLQPIQDFLKNNISLSALEKENSQIQKHLEEIKHSKKELELKFGISQKQIQLIEREGESLHEENKGIQTQIQKSMKEKNKIYSFLEKQKQMNLKFEEELKRISHNQNLLENQKKDLEIFNSQLAQDISVMECKIKEMKKLISQFENINEGATDLMKWRPEDFKPLFQSLKVEPEYAEALSSALGHHIQALVPKEDICIEQAVLRLKNLKKGRTSFISSLPQEAESLALKSQLAGFPAVICFLEEKVSLGLYTKSLKPFLGQTAVISDLKAGFELKRRFPSFQFVTKDGDLITKESLVYAGSKEKETSLFKIQGQIEEFSKELSAKKVEQKIKKLEMDSCIKKWNQTQQQAKDVESQNIENTEKRIAFQKDIERVEKDIVRWLENRKKNDAKIEDYDQEKQNLLKYKEADKQEIKSFEEVISEKERRLEDLSSSIEEQKSYNIKKLKWEKKLLENQKDQQNLDQEMALLSEVVQNSQQTEQEDQKGSALQKTDFNLKEELDLLDRERQKLLLEQKGLEKDLEQQGRLQSQKEKNLAELENQLMQAKMDLNNLGLAFEKKEFEKELVRNSFADIYKMRIENFVPSESSLENTDLKELQKERDYYQKKLDSMEGLNFLALEEYEALSKDNLFLNSQKEDLVKSKKDILKVISHIDKLCETRFKNMLEEINKRFSKVFPIIFHGKNAKAELILHEEEGNMEPGLDILIHPPGKRPQSVSLLSRGEKALTSICLIYSLFLVKPSPFCIIDEADAPLDDANIFRFISVLKEMSQKSQIITITHNKYTMQACKKLYGVTMERQGISQIVSVDMDSKAEFQPESEFKS